jgi:hypothetical protein
MTSPDGETNQGGHYSRGETIFHLLISSMKMKQNNYDVSTVTLSKRQEIW